MYHTGDTRKKSSSLFDSTPLEQPEKGRGGEGWDEERRSEEGRIADGPAFAADKRSGVAWQNNAHLSRRSHLTRTHLSESALSQDSVHPERLVRDRLTFQKLPLQITLEVHRVLELFERRARQKRLHLSDRSRV